MGRYRIRGILLGALATFGVIVLTAGSGAERYNPLGNADAPSAYTTAAGTSTWTSADSGSTATSPNTLKACGGNPSVAVRVDHHTHSATAAVACYLWHVVGGSGTETFLGVAAVYTSTASVLATDGSVYHGRSVLTYDTMGATHYELRVEAVSAGTVELTAWSYGADSR